MKGMTGTPASENRGLRAPTKCLYPDAGPEDLLFCGMSIGYEDETVPYIRTGRAPLDETVTFVQG